MSDSRETEDLRVLDALEDLEAERINFGLYDTFVSVDEVATRLAGGGAGDTAAARAALDRLARRGYVLELGEGRVRSRISETVRVLKRVKQRFSADDADHAPYLVNSVRVRFVARRRLRRDQPLDIPLQRLFAAYRGRAPRLDTARKAVADGVGAALGQPSTETEVTGIQARALAQVASAMLEQNGRGFVITGNTGSGKTEAALLPLMLSAVQERLNEVVGCKAILVYPRQELAKNQLERLCRYLAFVNRALKARPGHGGTSLTAGIVFGATPTSEHELRHGSAAGHRRAWTPLGDGLRLPYFDHADESAVVFKPGRGGLGSLVAGGGFEAGGWELGGFAATRDAVRASAPDFLVITTEMLHRWLNDPSANDLFGVRRPGETTPRFHAPRAVMLDEIHLYDAAHGAQVGMLVRRLRHRLSTSMHHAGDGWQFPVLIGMSATIGAPKRFWSELSGLRAHLVTEISPQDEELESGHGREYFVFVRPETYSRGRLVGDASVAIQSVMAIAHNMRRRGPTGDGPPKHRSLVFQDSISKIKKFALEFHDAEVNRFLAQYRLTAPDEPVFESKAFVDGEYWVFEASDPHQYAERRREAGAPPKSLTVSNEPVYGGRAGGSDLQRDIVFATTALEVGYDDPAIQFVLQHHAPRTPASFVQKKGRAGRSLSDRPISAVTLSRHSFRDAFYFQNPDLLCDPADYRPPLNVNNFFVQRFQALATLFDEFARLGRRNASWLGPGCADEDIDRRLAELRVLAGVHAASISRAYARVVSPSFRAAYPDPPALLQWLDEECADSDVRAGIRGRGDLLAGHPGLPDNLFSTVNLPTARVLFRPTSTMDWDDAEEDIALLFSEIAPGKVTRRFGRRHSLHWRPPDPEVAIERYKNRGARPRGPFRPDLVAPLERAWGPEWQRALPRRVREIHGGRLPEGFYRVRYVEVWNFGELDPADPKNPQASWRYWARRDSAGRAEIRYDRSGDGMSDPWRLVSPDSASLPLSFAHVRLAEVNGGEIAPGFSVTLPPLFPGLLKDLDGYCGTTGDGRPPMAVWEVHYGAEVRLLLVAKGRNDDDARAIATAVAYRNDADKTPLLYGHDVETEGLAVPFDRSVLDVAVEAVFERWWKDDRRRNHLQDQMLRQLLKTESWPAAGADPPLTVFEVRLAADVLSTARAEARARGESLGSFAAALANEAAARALLQDVRATYWRDIRRVTDEFVDRLVATLATPAVQEHLAATFDRLTDREALLDYLRATAVHSLKHAVRRLFGSEGYSRDEEVGSTAVLPFTHGHWGDKPRFFVFERNAGGNGSTRLVGELSGRGEGYVLNRWWEHALGCPVGQEEDFVTGAFTDVGDDLVQFARDFLAAAPKDRPAPRPALAALLPDFASDELVLARLASIVTSELTLAGESGIAVAALHHELQQLEEQLAGRFKRTPGPDELAGYTASQVMAAPAAWPSLAQLLDVYVRHADKLGQSGEPATTAIERFLDQVSQLLPRTCVDACPACLAGSCDVGPIDVTRHALSRRLLRAIHDELTAGFTVKYADGETRIESLVATAEAHDGWLILSYDKPIEATLAAGLRARFEERARIPEYPQFALRQILRLRTPP